MYSFGGHADGGFCYSGVVQGNDGNFYGTTAYAEPSTGGTIFKLTPSWQLTTLYGFCLQQGCPDGSTPQGNLIEDATGTFFGTTGSGGSPNNGGTVFKFAPDGTLTTLHRFCVQNSCSDGARPFSSLLRVGNGTLYGTTYSGGSGGNGTIYAVTTAGVFHTVHTFDFTHGANPYDALIKGPDGALYGTTAFGGPNDAGTIFKFAPGNTLTVLHTFNNCDGFEPQTSLILANDGNLYGTTSAGGTSNDGTVFRLTPN